jgi:hypothetical protein
VIAGASLYSDHTSRQPARFRRATDRVNLSQIRVRPGFLIIDHYDKIVPISDRCCLARPYTDPAGKLIKSEPGCRDFIILGVTS